MSRAPTAVVAPSRARDRRPVLLGAVGVLVALVVGASLGWRLAGGTLFTIATPSMCPDLCVGTLVLDRPLAGHAVAPGTVVTFRPPGTAVVYTHRVVRVLPGGALQTEGDALGRPDPWTVPRNRVIGVVVGSVGGLGWLWRSMPWMASVWVLSLLVRHAVGADERGDVDTVGAALAVALPALVLRPFTRTAVVAWRAHGAGIALEVVNTGLLAVHYTVAGGGVPGAVAPGHLRKLVAAAGPGVPVALRATPSLPPLGWAVAAAIVLSPVLALVGRTLAGRGGGAAGGPVRWSPVEPARRRMLLVVAVLAVAAVGLARRSPTFRHPNDQWPPVPRAPQAPADPPTA